MRKEIELYRGYKIMFDTDNETFYSALEDAIFGKPKRSYSAAKKEIDDAIKERLMAEFEPFEVVNTEGVFKKIVGLRKDGFIQEDKKMERSKFPEYYEKDFYKASPEILEVCAEMALIQYDIDELFKKKNALSKTIKGKTLAEIKKELIP